MSTLFPTNYSKKYRTINHYKHYNHVIGINNEVNSGSLVYNKY